MSEVRFYNSLTRKKEIFKPRRRRVVTYYSCGPTVYGYVHIGNLRSYILADTVRRALAANGYKVKHVMNITDVGHLVGDGDVGDDKVESAAKKEGKTAAEIASYYTNAFLEDCKKLNIVPPSKLVKASDHISEQIKMIQKLEKRGLAYTTSDGVYFDTAMYPAYSTLLGVAEGTGTAQARIASNKEKKSAHDFALWKFSGSGAKRLQEWPSPWGVGFPGWHIECSAMAIAYLGNPIDLHSGGIDHYSVHHPNEIAQAEGAGYVPFVTVWLHNEFLTLQGDKMAKSKGNIIRVSDLEHEGFSPFAYRYYLLNSHYRQKITFSREGLEGAARALAKIKEHIAELPKKQKKERVITGQMLEAVNDDLNTAKVLALLWDALRSDALTPGQKTFVVVFADSLLGLSLFEFDAVPKAITELADKRERARKEKNFKKADDYRMEIEKLGYKIKDTSDGPVIIRSQDV